MKTAVVQFLTALDEFVEALRVLQVSRSRLRTRIVVFNLKFWLFVKLGVAVPARHDGAGVAASASAAAHGIFH